MATMVLTVVGTVVGGPIGAAIGATLGQVIDNQVLFAPKGRQGARLSDLRLQTSRYGDQMPRLYGVLRVAGSVIWATDLVERRSTQSSGKGQPKVTTYSYSASFAVALSSRPIQEIRRIWADGNLLRGALGDFKTALGAFRLYTGDENQPVDPLMAAYLGTGITSAHRGLAYAVFEDLSLGDYGNRIPSLTFEVVADDGAVDLVAIVADISGGAVRAEVEGGPVMGYAAGGASIADALTPLVEAMDLALSMRESGLALTQSRETAQVVAENALGAAFNGKAERGIRRSRARNEDVSVRVTAHYYDPARDYQAGSQSIDRPTTGAAGGLLAEQSLDLPASIAAAEARTLAARLMQRLWVGRSALELRCDWTVLSLQPGDIVTVAGQTGRWRVEQSEWEAMGVRLRLKQSAANSIDLLPAGAGASVLQSDEVHGPTTLIVAELPALEEGAMVAPQVVVAAAGASLGWRRAELFVEETGTGGLVSIGASGLPATLGTIVIPPLSMASAGLIDTASQMIVDLLNDRMELSSVDDMALLAGANMALIGRELIQFAQAEKIAPRRWRLSRLLRGRRGTEWAMPVHDAGERFLLLQQQALVAVPSSAVASGQTVRINAVGIGDTVPVKQDEAVLGQAVLPLAPVHLSVTEDAGDMHIRWIRRSRAGWGWADGVDAPLIEETERYQLTLYHNDVAFRSVQTTEPAWIYATAARAEDAAAGMSEGITARIAQIGTYGTGRTATLNLAF